jgi:Mg2+ and Co2+ transporter CorA
MNPQLPQQGRAPLPAALARKLPPRPNMVAEPSRPQDNTGPGAIPPTPKELYEVAGQFKGLMLEEIAAIERHDYAALSLLGERKRILSGLFKEKQKVMMQHLDALKASPREERMVLADMLDELRAVARDNEIAVRGARDGHQRFLNAIIKGATKLEQLGNGYARNGRSTALSANYGAKRPVSLFSDTKC